MIYNVSVTFTEYYTCNVEAESKEQAERLALELMINGQLEVKHETVMVEAEENNA